VVLMTLARQRRGARSFPVAVPSVLAAFAVGAVDNLCDGDQRQRRPRRRALRGHLGLPATGRRVLSLALGRRRPQRAELRPSDAVPGVWNVLGLAASMVVIPIVGLHLANGTRFAAAILAGSAADHLGVFGAVRIPLSRARGALGAHARGGRGACRWREAPGGRPWPLAGPPSRHLRRLPQLLTPFSSFRMRSECATTRLPLPAFSTSEASSSSSAAAVSITTCQRAVAADRRARGTRRPRARRSSGSGRCRPLLLAGLGQVQEPASPREPDAERLGDAGRSSPSRHLAPSGRSHTTSLTSVPGMVRPWKKRLRWNTMCSRRSAISRA
jgi:hypothetical protein